MKIATWNLDRPKKTGKRLHPVSDYLNKINADILILTEATELISLRENTYKALQRILISLAEYSAGRKI